MIGVLCCAVGCSTVPVTNITYPNTPTYVNAGGNQVTGRPIGATRGLTAFEQWLMTYTPPQVGTFITTTDADKCIAELRKAPNQDVKDAALWQLNYYQDWSYSQMDKLSSSISALDEDNQWDLLSLMQTMFTDDFNAPTAEQYCKGWLKLMGNMKNKDDASSAADEACYYAHPVLMNRALAVFNGNIDPDYEVNGIAPYFAYYYYDSFVSDIVDEEPSRTLKKRWAQWWKPETNKLTWMYANCDYVSAPRKYMKDGPVYAYIFTVSNYPDQWGDIDLPGTAKDATKMEAVFRQMPSLKVLKKYVDANATYTNFLKVWAEITALDSNEICFIYFSGHGATDDKGKIWYALLYDFNIDYVHGEFINTPKGAEVKDLMYGAKYMHNNKLIFFMSDSCLAGGFARATNRKTKSFRPTVWGEQPIIPDVYYDMSYKNCGNFILACRENQYSYDTPDGGAFTKRYTDIWLNKKFKVSFGDTIKATGKKLLQDGFGQTPVMCCPKGNDKLSIYK